jgi:hypothetical protein
MALRIARGPALVALLVALSSPAVAQTSRLEEFPFAAGAGGFAVTDTGRPADVKAFSTGGFQVFWEVKVEPGVALQVRYENFLLPGSAVGAPRVKVNAGSVSVSYVFREAWWQAGFFAGVGVYGLSPRAPEAGQAPADISETVIGWHGGVRTVFELAPRWDLRVEAAGYLLRTDAPHKPILVGASLAYHF